MKTTIELTDEDVKEILNDVFKIFAKRMNLPIAGTPPSRVLFVSSPISIDTNVKGSLIVAEDTVMAHVKYPNHQPIPPTAYLTLKEIWPGKFFILLCS